MTSNSSRALKNVDWLTVILYVLLVGFGWLNIYAANTEPGVPFNLSMDEEYTKQLLWIGISAVSIGFIFLIDSKFYVEFANIFYLITIILLISVIFIGVEVNAARSWFQLGSFRFQPVELAKVATTLAIARLMSRFQFSLTKWPDRLALAALWLTPIIIIILQNDTGSALVFFAFLIVFFREGMTPYILLFGVIAIAVFISTLLISNQQILGLLYASTIIHLLLKKTGKITLIAIILAIAGYALMALITYAVSGTVNQYQSMLSGAITSSLWFLYSALSKRLKHILISLTLFWGAIGFAYSTDYFFEKVLTDYQRTRILVMLGLKNDPLGAGYNVNQSKIAIGSGGFSGKGFLQGTQTKFNFVPEQSTDFIFCTVGEEWGFIGTAGVILVFLALLIRLVILSEHQHSNFSRIYGYSVAAIFFLHMSINIGMTIGLAPVIGIPLPFFSYGGSSLWGFTILLFIFLKLDTNRAQLIR